MLLLTLWVALLVPASAGVAEFVGTQACAACHAAELQEWRGSHHQLAMLEASPDSVLGDFSNVEFSAHGVTSRFYREGDSYKVRTDGPDGKLHDYTVRYTFGWYPLQQYLIELERGRIQALGIAWDSRTKDQGGQRWFHLYPDEPMDANHPLHWTGREQNWNYQCAECHSTDLHKNYAPDDDSYATRWTDINVGCEACHGPGSEHVKWAGTAASSNTSNDKGLVVDLRDTGGVWIQDPEIGQPKLSSPRTQRNEIQVCARCHSRRGQASEPYQHGKPITDTHSLALLDDHLYFPDGQIKDEVYVYGSFIQSRMYQAGVTCSDCHQVHSTQLLAEGNALCTRCHNAASYDSEAHHHHPVETPGAACTACHMPQRNYMRIDARADHSLRVPRPDLSAKLGTPNACNGCHVDKDSAWAAEAVSTWYPDSPHRGAHFGEVLHASVTDQPGVGDDLVALAADSSQPAIARASALDRLRGHAQPSQMITVRRLLADPSPLVRAAALRWLEVLGLAARVDVAWPSLTDPDLSVRLEAARLLAPVLQQQVPERFRQTLQQAVDDYLQAQRVNAERPESQLNIGLIEADAGRMQSAAQAYRQALKLDPLFAPGYVNLADLLRRTGDEQQAQEVLKEGLQRIPEHAELQHALGLALVREKKLPEAEPYLAKAAELAPENARFVLVHALALQGMGDLEQALGVLTQARLAHPRDRDLLLALIEVHRQRGETEAIEPLQRELESFR